MRTRIVIVAMVLIICVMLLAACGAGAQNASANSTQVVATFVAQITQTAKAAEIDSWLADADTTEPTTSLTEEPTETDVPFSTATPDPNQQLLSKFRTVTVSKGNLYVRDGLGVPVQITKSGTDHDPIISSDGKKIIFYRGDKRNNFFVINADGSDEKPLISKDLLPALGDGFIPFLLIQPDTYKVFFHTYVCTTLCKGDIFSVDMETNKITTLVNQVSGFPAQRHVFSISPDGEYLLVTGHQQLDLYNVNGKMIHPTIVKNSDEAYWLPDSSGFIIFGLDSSILRYILKDDRLENIDLNPQPLMHSENLASLVISPDHNWVLYQDKAQKVYLGNLKDEKVQAYDWYVCCSDSCCGAEWSQDSKHFVGQTPTGIIIGSVDGTPPIKIDGHFIAWLDATHYLFSKGKEIIDLQTYVAEVGKESAAAPTNFIWSPVYAVMEPTPAP